MEQAIKGKNLSGRYLDFWLLGGASIVIWIFIQALSGLKDLTPVSRYYVNIAAVGYNLAILVNYPHFMASYKIAYSQGRKFIYQNWFHLIFIPLALFCLITIGYAYYLPGARLDTTLPVINSFFTDWGWSFQFSTSKSFGQDIMRVLINTMYLTVGWHYIKQIYGCMMVYARFDNYKLSFLQAKIIKYNLYGLWGINIAYGNASYYKSSFHGIEYFSLNVGSWMMSFFYVYLVVSFVLFLYFVLYKKYLVDKQKPSANFLVPLAAIYIWWFPLFILKGDFYFYLTPFFHSLQYLVFVVKFENTNITKKYKTDSKRSIMATVLIFALIITGALSFDILPAKLDQIVSSNEVLNASFFLASAHLFINIHHYFIDNVIWKFKNSHVKEYLFD